MKPMMKYVSINENVDSSKTKNYDYITLNI